MTVVGRMLGGTVLGLALFGLAVGSGGSAVAEEGGGAHGAASFRDTSLRIGGFYGGPDSRAYSGFGAHAGGDRLAHYGRPLSPFPCPYPSLYVVPSAGSGSR